jgi:uncharacterized protein YjbJ (UPF0337 family)
MSLIYLTRGALLTIVAAFALSTACFAADTQKWAPPNVVGMPGYTPQAQEPGHAPQGRVPAVRQSITTWSVISGGWKQFSGKVKEQWGRLTDDELAEINGKRESLEGMLQQKYGYTPEEAKREVDAWVSRN